MTRLATRTSWCRLVTVAAGVIQLSAAPAHAQFDTAQVSGVVQDTTGGVLPGVDVTLTAVGTGIERRAVTNETGLYTFTNVTVGEYRLAAALTGFKSVTRSGLTLSAGVNIRVDVQLGLVNLSETILVEATVLHVDTAVIGRTLRAE